MSKMNRVLKKILPVKPSISDDGDDDDADNVDYSFAIEYTGPRVKYEIPRATPLKIDLIPTAASVASASQLNELSLPVIQPIVTKYPLKKKVSDELKLETEANKYPNPLTFIDCRVTESNDCASSGAELSKSNDKSCKSSDENNGKDDGTARISNGIESSGTLGFSDTCDESRELSTVSKDLGSSDTCDESQELAPVSKDLAFSEICDDLPELSPRSKELGVSCEISPCEDETCNIETPHPVKRAAVVTFLDPELSESVHDEIEQSEADTFEDIQTQKRKVKKGLCHRCLRGSRLIEKEVCIVCGAKYCGNCMLRAMGSMPEGRKCVTCIGCPIDESKREQLGKCSRFLKKLVGEIAAKHIMRSEVSAEANQLPSQLVYVNGNSLCREEMILLQSCLHPPKKLKPGKYWYDKVSGFWGKEGQKPCQIISPNLNVGGSIMRNASNGNTRVLINNREITKPELRMLQWAGVQCAGYPQFWVNADGSYLEEGQAVSKGRIWGKKHMKLICAALSLPSPPDPGKEANGDINGVSSNHDEQRMLHKLLLVGSDESGTSTIYKQAKLLYNPIPFSEDEGKTIKVMIQSNLYRYIGILLEGREKFEEECLLEIRKRRIEQPGTSEEGGKIDDKTIYSIGPRLKAFSNWLLEVMASGNLEAIFPAATLEYSQYVEDLWKDKAFQATYNRRSELQMLPRAATYFLDRASEISRMDYMPSDMDILYADGITSFNGVAFTEFSFPQSTCEDYMDSHEPDDLPRRYQLIRPHVKALGENCKWLDMFEDVNMVLFCVSLCDYDQFYIDNTGVLTNKMMASRKLFENIVTHPSYNKKEFLLLLNKFDLLEENLERVPLNRCEWFSEFNPVISVNPKSNKNNIPPLAQRAFHYIGVKFKRLFKAITGRKLHVSMVTGLETDSVDEAFKYMAEIIKWKDNYYVMETDEVTPTCSTEGSSSAF